MFCFPGLIAFTLGVPIMNFIGLMTIAAYILLSGSYCLVKFGPGKLMELSHYQYQLNIRSRLASFIEGIVHPSVIHFF
jgi:hypothetical protein